MAERLAHAGASFELHYCTREPARAAFRERLDAPHRGRQSRLYFDNGPADERVDLPKVLGTPAIGKHVYVCGPGGFIEAVLKHTRELGWGSANVHREYFAAARSGVAANAHGPFQVKLASSGRAIYDS